jgi:tetratricopeptide (TPR) repeat protein
MWPRLKIYVSERRWPLALAAATAAVRAVYLLSVSGDPFFQYLRHIPDSFFFNNWAQGITSGDWLGKGVFFIGPLYPYFLAGIYKLFGPDLTLVRVVHVALDAGSALFLYGFGRRVMGEWPGRVAAILWAVYLPAIFFSSFVLPVSLDIFLISASFYLLARGAEGRARYMAGAGALLGFAALDRTNLLVFAAAAVPVFIIYIRRLGWRRLAYYFAPIILIIGVVTARNAAVGGDAVIVSSQGGVNFFLGNSARAKGTYWNLGAIGQGRPEELNRDLARALAEEEEGRRMKPSEISRWWFKKGVNWIKENPGDAALLYWRKFRFFTSDFETSLNVDFYFMKFITPFHRVQLPYFGFLFPFGVLGLLLGWRRPSFARTTAALFVVVYSLSVMAFFISARYRLPVVPLLMVFAGAGLTRLISLWRAWRWRPAAALTAAAMALGTFSMWPLKQADRDGAFGQSYYRYGKYYFDEGDYEKAVPYLRKSARLAPEIYGTNVLLGISYDRLGQHDTALVSFYQAYAEAPHVPEVRYNLGVALIRGGQVAEGVAYLERAVKMAPDYVEAWQHLADVYSAAGNLPGAEVAYRRLLDLTPGDPRVAMNLAEVLSRQGRGDEAVTYAARALAVNPAAPGANFLIGRWYFTSGDYLTAGEYMRAELARDPSSAQAWAALAMSYLELGDARGAADAYNRYLREGGQRDPAFERDAGLE